MEEPCHDSCGTVDLEYPCLPILGISYASYHKGTKLSSRVELFNIFNLNNEDGLPPIMIFDSSIIFELFF